MKATRLLASLAILASLSGVAQAQTACARLSWNSCDPWNAYQAFLGPAKYSLVEVVQGLGTPNVGTDTQIRIWLRSYYLPDFPDAWRFDDVGCQAGRMTVSNNNFSKSCPVMKGTNPQTNVQYVVDTNTIANATLRLAITYDPFAPVATTRYALWQIRFDHSRSVTGPSPADHSACGYADICAAMTFDFVRVFTTTGQVLSLPGCDSPCVVVYWNVNNCGDFPGENPPCFPVPTQAPTWGRLRSLYR